MDILLTRGNPTRCVLFMFVLLVAVGYSSRFGPLNASLCRAEDGPMLSVKESCIWTGKEMMLWDGGKHLWTFAPAKNTWLTLAVKPHNGTIIDPQLVRFSDRILAIYFAKGEQTELCVDDCSSPIAQWHPIARVNRNDLRDDRGEPVEDLIHDAGGPNERRAFGLRLVTAVATDAGLFIFVEASHCKTILSINVALDGKVKFLSGENSPHALHDGVAVYSWGNEVFYYVGQVLDANKYWILNAATGSWSKPQVAGGGYAFGHCSSVKDVYIFGGSEGSGSAVETRGGVVYSFEKKSWRDMPLENGPRARREPAMCWTGLEMLVWGGEVGRALQPDGLDAPLNAVMAFDPAISRWRLLENHDAPSSRADSTALWTGKEMIVGGAR